MLSTGFTPKSEMSRTDNFENADEVDYDDPVSRARFLVDGTVPYRGSHSFEKSRRKGRMLLADFIDYMTRETLPDWSFVADPDTGDAYYEREDGFTADALPPDCPDYNDFDTWEGLAPDDTSGFIMLAAYDYVVQYRTSQGTLFRRPHGTHSGMTYFGREQRELWSAC